MADGWRQDLVVTARVKALRGKMLVKDLVRWLLLGGMLLGILGVFGVFFEGVPTQLTIAEAPAWLNAISVWISTNGFITIPAFAFLAWQSTKW